ncbi:MAG: carboxypeptidase regulatory-like domain-containing protein [Rhodanobacteraceae bacterium]|nr:carboxypeptidase regulatory-like domain-containing protein [Rhodanobacteraceae bacterium]
MAAAATVRGRVIDETTQQPIAGAEVFIYQRFIMGLPTEIASTTTGPDGRYSVQFSYDLPVGAIAEAAGYAARTHDGRPCTGAYSCAGRDDFYSIIGNETATDFALGRAARISGIVRDAATGEPVSHAWVSVRGNGQTTSSQLGASLTTDSQGRFSAESLPAGSYTLATSASVDPWPNDRRTYLSFFWPDISCDNVQQPCSSVAPGLISVTAGQSRDLDIPLRRGSYLRTRIISLGNGMPTVVHQASARAIAAPLTGVSGTTADDEGYVEVGPLLPGPLYLVMDSAYPQSYADMIYPDRSCPSSGCDFSNAPLVEVPATDGIHTLADMYVQPLRSVRGRVTSASDGAPIAGLRVSAGNLHEPQGNTWGFRSTASALTDANGNYMLEGFDAAEIMVRTRQNGLGWLDKAWQNKDCDAANLFCERETQHEPLTFDQHPHQTDINFVLGRGASLSGHVIEETTNRPLANYAVAVVPLAALRIGKPVFTDASGYFRIDGLTHDSYYLFASAQPVYGNTAGVIYPGGPCSFSVLSGGLNSCFPTPHQPLIPPAGGVLDHLSIIMPRPDAIFRSRFDS